MMNFKKLVPYLTDANDDPQEDQHIWTGSRSNRRQHRGNGGNKHEVPKDSLSSELARQPTAGDLGD